MENKNMGKVLISSVFASCVVFGLVFFISGARAESSSSASSSSDGGSSSSADQQAVTIATVNIYNAKIVSQDGNKFKLSFDINNEKDVQPQIKYSVQLVQGDAKGKNVIDTKNYDEIISLGAGETLHKEIDYVAPDFLNGKYQIWILGFNLDNLPLGLNLFGDVTLTGSGEYVNIIPGSCYLTVQGEKDKKYTLAQGVDIAKDESLTGNCEVKNNFKNSVSAIPVFTTYFQGSFGKLISSQDQAAISLASGEQKQIQFTIPKADNPQAYDAVLVFQDAQKENISNQMPFHYVLQGASATIRNLRLDKDYYAEGDNANISFNWTASADNFVGSRAKAGSVLTETDLEIQIKDAQGKACSDVFQSKLDVTKIENNFTVPITANCLNPQIGATIKDAAGNILDANTFGVTSKSKTNNPAISGKTGSVVPTYISSKIKLALAVIIIILIVLLVVLYRKIRVSGIKTIILFILLSGGIFLAGGNGAKANTVVVGGYAHGVWVASVYATNFNYPNWPDKSYHPNQMVTVNALAYGGNCSNGWQFLELDADTPITGNKSVIYFSNAWNYTTQYDSFSIPAPPFTGGPFPIKFTGYGLCLYPDCDRTWPIQPPAIWLAPWPNPPYPSNPVVPPQVSFTTYLGVVIYYQPAPIPWSFPPPPYLVPAPIPPASQAYNSLSWAEDFVVTPWPPPASCNLPWGGTISSGQGITAYANSSPVCGSSCASEWRVCTNGTLSGSYTNSNCSVQACAPCTLPWGGSIDSGSSVTAYQESTHCVSCTDVLSETRTCNNGTLSGSYAYQNCSPISAVPGACGSSNGAILRNPPTDNLCSAGSPSPATLSGNGPWSWQCSGVCTGQPTSCSAKLDTNWREVSPN